MEICEKALDLIKEYEGYCKALPDGSCMAYQEVLGHKNGQPILDIPTLGWGCTEGVKMGMTWTNEEATAALRRELAKHEKIVDRIVTADMNQYQRGALVSFNYNCGKLQGSTLLKKFNAGDVEGAADEFSRFTKAGGVVQRGLVRRRAAEKALFLTPDGEERHAAPQTIDAPRIKVSAGDVVKAAFGTGLAATGAHQSGVVPKVDVEATIATARAKVDQAKQAREIVTDAGGFIPPALLKNQTAMIGVGAVLALAAALIFIARKKA